MRSCSSEWCGVCVCRRGLRGNASLAFANPAPPPFALRASYCIAIICIWGVPVLALGWITLGEYVR